MEKGIVLNVVLVGSSPLPCYIQVEYALAEHSEIPRPDYILFVATENESDKYVENIKYVLAEKGVVWSESNCETFKLKDGYNSYDIEQQVWNKICDIHERKKIEQILLNNTGGTKAMAVYATSAVRKFEKEKYVPITECFVDPRENRLRCYKLGENGAGLYPSFGKGTLKDIVRLNVKELVQLHYGQNVTIDFSDKDGVDKKGKSFDGLEEGQMKIAQKILMDEQFYDAYCELHKIYEKYHDVKKKNQRIDKMIEDLQRESKVDVIESIFEPSGRKLDFKKDKKYILTFMEGEWLEKYFYRAILDAKERLYNEKNISIQTVWSCKVKPEEQYGKDFEVDILAIKGYELTLFSVSMANSEKLAKGKWFEAVYRTEQMAGEHGKVSVVNFLGDSTGIEKFKLDLKTFKREVDIYNREDMGDYEILVKTIVERFEQ